MPIDQVANYAEIFGALAVVVSLIYVALQVRANTREQRLTRANEAADNYSRFQTLLIENPEFRDIWIKGADDISVLSPSELLGFGAYMALWVDSATRVQAQQRSGYRTAPINALADRYKPIVRRRGAFQWWQRARGGYDADLVKLLDDIFEAAGHKREAEPTHAH